MRRSLRVILWNVKGLLLLIALSALVMWPVSRGRQVAVRADRYTAGPGWGEERTYIAACWDGWTVIRRRWKYAWRDPWLGWIRWQVESGADGWRWGRWAEAYTWDERLWAGRWGPLRWGFTDYKDPESTAVYRRFAVPLWLVALAAGAWPALSIAFAVRRRRARRRAAMTGCCKRCGYDLRATPAAGGELLPVCPECGATSSTRNTPSPPT